MSKRILFVLASPEYLRYVDTTMTLLADRGHAVSVGVNWLRERKHARLDELIADPRIEIVGQVPSRADMWVHTARAVRGSFDYVRYLHPSLAGASALRERSRRKSAPRLIWGLDRVRSLRPATLERLYGVLRAAEAAVPVSRKLVEFLRRQQPDLVVVSPLVDSMSDQVDMVRAAQSLGIPCALAVASWDNLTNKGHLRVTPDAVTVWNARQKEEAVTLHGVPAERVSVTGAQLFDRWFERRPSQDRASFCRMVGLPDERPIILYTASSIFIARSELEVPFVRKWLAALRATDAPGLRDAAVLVRPHPFNSEAWETADLSDLGPVSIWPRARYTPASERSRDAFFDSLYYSSAVVGINTSAMIEAAILRKPVLSLLTPEFARTQEGTLHFHYLLPENGGFLRVASSIDRHVEQLSDVIQHPDVVRGELDRFVGSFIRPHGMHEPCTPKLADALERAAAPVQASRESFGVHAARAALFPVAVVVDWFSPPLDADGKSGQAWWKKADGERLIKRLVVGPIRAIWRGLRSVTRRVRALPARAMRLARHGRYHVAVWVRGFVPRANGSDGRH